MILEASQIPTTKYVKLATVRVLHFTKSACQIVLDQRLFIIMQSLVMILTKIWLILFVADTCYVMYSSCHYSISFLKNHSASSFTNHPVHFFQTNHLFPTKAVTSQLIHQTNKLRGNSLIFLLKYHPFPLMALVNKCLFQNSCDTDSSEVDTKFT